MAGVSLHVIDALAFLGHENGIPFFRGGSAQRRGSHLEIGAVGVVDDEDLVAGRFGGVFQALAAVEDLDALLDILRGNKPHIRGGHRGGADNNPLAVAGLFVIDGEALVVFLEEDRVVEIADAVEVDLPLAPRIVHAGIGNRAGIGRPGQAVADIAHRIVHDLAGFDIENAQGEMLIAGEIHAHRAELAVRGGHEAAAEEEFFPEGELVAVPHREFRERRVEVRAGGAARGGAEHRRVLPVLESAPVIPPVPHAVGQGAVGFLGARLEFGHEVIAQIAQPRGLLPEIGVFGVEERADIRIGFIAQPLVVIDVGVAVESTFGRDLLRNRADSHGGILLEMRGLLRGGRLVGVGVWRARAGAIARHRTRGSVWYDGAV